MRRGLLHWTGFDVSSTTSLACRLHFFLVYFFSQLSSSTVAVLSADRAVMIWRSVPAARLYGRRRMAVLWTTVATVLCAINLHFFWTAQHISASSAIADMNNGSSQSGFTVSDDNMTSKSASSPAHYNYSALQSSSDSLPLSAISEYEFSFSHLLPFPEELAVLGTSKSTNATVTGLFLR